MRGKAAENEADRQHAHAHDALVHFAHVARQLLEPGAKRLGQRAFERARRSSSSIDWVITSSPTVFMSSSIFSTPTRIEPGFADATDGLRLASRERAEVDVRGVSSRAVTQ